ncbi:MAG: hypothetical protein HRU75_02930 [Planctomycetia bacterium]|nr:MAG: hypothetical protein HRU75_02930 [Planctomycetia bacterium]
MSKHRYVYGGWSLLMELPVTGSDESLTVGDPARMYTWGLDISGQSGNATAGSGDSSVSGLHGAGGIGGLLAVLDTNNTTTTSDDRNFTYCYDANGNVGQLVEWASGAGGASGMAWAAGRMAATYEYDPYGNTVSKSGTYSDTNSFRFSTKFFDPETGLYYYGYRYYSPRLGRWIRFCLTDRFSVFVRVARCDFLLHAVVDDKEVDDGKRLDKRRRATWPAL